MSKLQQTTEFLNTTLESVRKTFIVALYTEIANSKSMLRKPGERAPRADVAAIVGLLGAHFSGTLTIAFPEQTYLKIMSRMLQMEFSTMCPDIEDGAAEILNMILGQTKSALNEKGFGIKQVIPTVVRGADLELRANTKSPSILIPYTSDAGEFYVELAFSPPSK